MKKVLPKPVGLLLCSVSLCVNAYAESAEDVSPETRQAAQAYWTPKHSSEGSGTAGRSASNPEAAVASYVASTRELAQGDYTIVRLPDQGRLQVYRVSVDGTVRDRVGGERAFDVFVDDKSAIVTAEDYAE